MVSIVTGTINSGKTTRMKALHDRLGGDGFVMEKTMDDDTVRSYHAHRLATGERRLLVLREGYDDPDFTEETRIGPYRFDANTLEWVEHTMRDLIRSGLRPLYLDEIGKLELRGEGFDAILDDLAKMDVPLYISVREDLISDVIRRYKFKQVTVQGLRE